MLSNFTKIRLDHAVTSVSVADEISSRLIESTPALAADAQTMLDAIDSAKNDSIVERLKIALAGDGAGSAGSEIASKVNAMVAVLEAKANGNEVLAAAATATLTLTADITLTSVATGTARNTNTFTTQVLAAAANPTDTVLVDFTGTADAIVCTITPNDGTNNAATPVDLTTAELVELINTGAVVGKNVTITDASSFRALQTATGGGTTALADAGEGDGVVGTFAGGVDAADTDIAPAQAAMGSDEMSDATFENLVIALADRSAAEEFRTAYNAMIGFVQAIA